MEGDPDNVSFTPGEVVQVLSGLIDLLENRGKFELGFSEHSLGATVFEISGAPSEGGPGSLAIERPLRNYAGMHLFIADATVTEQYADYFESHWSRAEPERDKVLEYIRDERKTLKFEDAYSKFSWPGNG